jgi:hypothetical protein
MGRSKPATMFGLRHLIRRRMLLSRAFSPWMPLFYLSNQARSRFGVSITRHRTLTSVCGVFRSVVRLLQTKSPSTL